ncbi:dipeptidase [Afifella pfennigii]|uniref:dipeptidase n=1 Tax=Afifella pfennigii TaxID=209897 RepID=UPI0004794DCB|nr:dipeptidase [Afifella pfennigii]
MLDHTLARIDEAVSGEALERLFQLIRIPSISADPAYAQECQKAAEYCAAQLAEIGFEASVRPTTGHPMVVGHYKAAGADKPHILFYGHYDVQPVDPVELWEHPPFEPRVAGEDGKKRILGRGSSDDKGQFMTFFEAARALMAEEGGLPVNITVLLEGEEESASPSLVPFLNANAEELKADVAFVCDTSMWDAETPAISTRLRGLVYEELFIEGPSHDLHSGHYGSAARNPIHVLAKVLADLRDEDGRIQIPGFYEGVPELTAEEKAAWESLGFSEKAFLGEAGLSIPAGEKGYSTLEQIWSRPTAEVNGIIGGYTGEGGKTVIPSKASAKISFRLVGEQDPEKIREAFHAFVKARIPGDCTVTFKSHGGERAITQPGDSAFVKKSLKALSDEWGKEAKLIGMGGSIPIVALFRRILGMDTVLVGFALDDDRIHSPNEKYNLKSFHGGARSWARILTALGE